MKLLRRRRKNNKGFSLVEVVCAIAVMGLATTAIGSAMIASTSSYQRGSAEVDVQKEAQTTANLIGNLLVDAVEASKSADGKVITIKGEGKEYELVYDSTAKTITYYEKNSDGTEVDGQLAADVSYFNVNLDKFANSKNAKVELTIDKNGKDYKAAYNTTARNGSANVVGAAEVAIISIEQEVILEPNQSYDFPITILGMPASEANITWSSISAGAGSELGGTVFLSKDDDGASVQIGAEAKGVLLFSVSTYDSVGNALDTKLVTIKIRSVEDIKFTETCTGNACKENTVYRVYAEALGNHFDRAMGKSYDDTTVNPEYAYKSPKPMQFTYKIEDASGNELDKDLYIELKDLQENVENPYIEFKLKKDMPSEAVITVTALSKHAKSEGLVDGPYNKKNKMYDNLSKDHLIENTRGSVYLKNGIQRGNDYFMNGINEFEGPDPETIKGKFGGEPRWYIRYRVNETGAVWTPYYRNVDNSFAKKFNAKETRLWLPDKAYQIQVILVSIENPDSATPKLKYPQDTTLLTDESLGFTKAFPGLTQGWTEADLTDVNKKDYVADTFSEYGGTMELGATEVLFYNSPYMTDDDNIGIESGKYDSKIGSGKDDPGFTLSRSGTGYNSSIYFTYATKNLTVGHYSYTKKVSKYSESAGWEDVTDLVLEKKLFDLQLDGGNVRIVNIQSDGEDYRVPGSYRVEISVTGAYQEPLEGSNTKTGIVYYETPPVGSWMLSDEASGRGCVYFNIVD